ncbi:MAG: DUF3786 domain-containing protein [Chloroflexi bacterium]|nr:DUF3786 domain-containing protein [Chloroflexota bacterium]
MQDQRRAEGEEQVWPLLSRLDPGSVCLRARVEFDESSCCYVLPMFSGKAFVSPGDKRIRGDSVATESFLDHLPQSWRMTALRYLVDARDVPLSGILINPRELKSGLMFTEGTHALPFHRLVHQYANNIDGFVQRGIALGGEKLDYGDSSLRLLPFPRIPVVLIIWKADNEFPARADLLFDSTCALHLATDILWSTAMLTILAMLG